MVDRDKIRSEMVQRLRRANVSLDLFDRNAIADELERLQEGIADAVPLILEPLILEAVEMTHEIERLQAARWKQAAAVTRRRARASRCTSASRKAIRPSGRQSAVRTAATEDTRHPQKLDCLNDWMVQSGHLSFWGVGCHLLRMSS